jgi:putative sugar O-methyltransferase
MFLEKSKFCWLDSGKVKKKITAEEFSFRKEEFKRGFPNYLQEKSSDLDSKHRKIIETINQAPNWLDDLNYQELRDWSEQNDLGVPTNFAHFRTFRFDFGRKWVRYFYHTLFYRVLNRELKKSLIDDLEIIKSIGGKDLLSANPVESELGNPMFWRHDGYSINTRWLRYIYLATRIRSSSELLNGGTWLDIGSYYGGLQSIVAKQNIFRKIILVDFHHQLFRSYVYLQHKFPNAIHDLGGSKINSCDKESLSFHYLHVDDLNLTDGISVDLVTNFFSFGEMRRDTFLTYKHSKLLSRARTIYLVNRFISSPFFEATYDSDLTVVDYQFPSHALSEIDIFPIHYFSTLPRKLLGSTRPRSISSPYFEGTWKIKHDKPE